MSTRAVFADLYQLRERAKIRVPGDDTWIRECVDMATDPSVKGTDREVVTAYLETVSAGLILWAIRLQVETCEVRQAKGLWPAHLRLDQAAKIPYLRIARRMINRCIGPASRSESGRDMIEDAYLMAHGLTQGVTRVSMTSSLEGIARKCADAAYAGDSSCSDEIDADLSRIIREGFGLV